MAAPVVAEGAAVTAFRSVMLRVRQAAERSGTRPESVRILAVSKTKPVSMIRQLYDAGQRSFGENYVQEIVDKAPQLPQDIEWHFIGHLQSNKAKMLLGLVGSSFRSSSINWLIEMDGSFEIALLSVSSSLVIFGGVPNLAMVEGIDNQKVANYLDRMVSTLGRNPLKILVQVNTSGEASKSGIDPSNCVELAKHVKFCCPNLLFTGLMTIGKPDYTSTPENFKQQMAGIFSLGGRGPDPHNNKEEDEVVEKQDHNNSNKNNSLFLFRNENIYNKGFKIWPQSYHQNQSLSNYYSFGVGPRRRNNKTTTSKNMKIFKKILELKKKYRKNNSEMRRYRKKHILSFNI